MSGLISNGRCIPYDPSLVELARDLRQRMTPQEQQLWEFLKTQKPRFHRQKPILYYIVDFYCPACRLVIEIDGKQHETREGQAYDTERTKSLLGFDILVLRFSNQDIVERLEDVCQKITATVTQTSKPTNTKEWSH